MSLSRAGYRAAVNRYLVATSRTQFELSDVVQWLRDRNELPMTDDDVAEFHRDKLGQALRSATTRDVGGRKVRLLHCVTTTVIGADGRPRQRTSWSHVDHASDAFLFASLHQRYRAIGEDVGQLRADVTYMNERLTARGLPLVQMCFDFSRDRDGEGEATG